ncbi:MAG: ABC transporter ATP-binding protein [Firmicutes bacterium]|nr:ABC transporter ATP-binding protein [Bacillota bacterium]
MNSVLSLSHVTLVQHGRTLLKDVSWTVAPGQHWALLGPNGAGKTSLLNIIMGYQWPTSGTVEVLGRRFGQADLRQLRTEIGWVSASLVDWLAAHHGKDSVREVVASGRFASIGLYQAISPTLDSAVEEALELFALTDRSATPFRHLSQGERQRAILARAWMAQPKLLILDEPASGLDLPGRETLLQVVERLTHSSPHPTLLYVTHHPEELIPEISHVLLLRAGEVLGAGPKGEWITDAHLTRLFGLAVRVWWEEGRPWIMARAQR